MTGEENIIFQFQTFSLLQDKNKQRWMNVRKKRKGTK